MMQRLAIFAFGFIIMGASSCKEDIDKSDGPIASSQSILSEICYKLSASQVSKFKVGETSIAAKSMSYFSGASTVVEAHRLQVLSEDRETCDISDGEQVACNKYEFFEELEDIVKGDRFHFERKIYLPVIESASLQNPFSNKSEVTKRDSSEAMDSSIDQEICYLTEDLYAGVGIKMTFHNFTKKSIERDPPTTVRQRANCGGIENCKILSTEYQFDQLFIAQDGTRFKRHFTYEVSNNVPFLSRYLKRCITHSIPQHFDDNQNGNIDEGEIRIVPVHECRDVVDFQFAP